MRLLGDAGLNTESGPHPVVISAIKTGADQDVPKVLQRTSSRTAVKQAVHNVVLEPHVMNSITTRVINSHAFTVPAAMFVKNEG